MKTAKLEALQEANRQTARAAERVKNLPAMYREQVASVLVPVLVALDNLIKAGMAESGGNDGEGSGGGHGV